MGTRDDDSPADTDTGAPPGTPGGPPSGRAAASADPALAPADRSAAVTLLGEGTKPSLVASMLVGRGYPPDAARRLTEALARKHARPRAPAPTTSADDTPEAAPHAGAEPPPGAARSPTAGLANILFGLVFVVGGASGQLALRGTGSSVALIAVGVGLLVWGVAQRFR
ncbi:MAG: hypothetical protein IT373_10820 [Polyangiaceae bacterium]|nr:hypothetical protein [Polyangiaceae bacterium]